MSLQTVIPSVGDSEQTFQSFYPGQNDALVRQLVALTESQLTAPALFIWGQSGAGKTHLLNACCENAKEMGRSFVYISADTSSIASLSSSDGLTGSVFCIDNIEIIAGDPDAAVALLSCYEQCLASGGCMIVAAAKPLDQINLGLADLASRLSAGGSFYVEPLNENDRRVALKQRAEQRGFEISDGVLDYIMSRVNRDAGSLFALLDKIDHASLSSQRKVTVPFVRELLKTEN